MNRQIILAMLSLLAGCSQEVENPVADHTWPVIQALLSFQDSVHVVHVGKTFSGTHVDDMVRNPDSLYFSDAVVLMDIYLDDFRIKTVPLERVDTLLRNPGNLPSAPYTVFVTTEPIYPGGVEIRVEVPSLGHYAQAGVGIRGKPHFTHPNPLGNKRLDFWGEYAVRIVWDGYKEVSETIVRMWYLEITVNGTDTCKLDWVRYSSDFVLEPEKWFDLMNYSIPADNQVLARRLLWIDLVASGGNWQWSQYLVKRDAVFDLITQPYTGPGIAGAYGFVGSRATGELFNCQPDKQFLDSLSLSPRVAHLKFVQ